VTTYRRGREKESKQLQVKRRSQVKRIRQRARWTHPTIAHRDGRHKEGHKVRDATSHPFSEWQLPTPHAHTHNHGRITQAKKAIDKEIRNHNNVWDPELTRHSNADGKKQGIRQEAIGPSAEEGNVHEEEQHAVTKKHSRGGRRHKGERRGSSRKQPHENRQHSLQAADGGCRHTLLECTAWNTPTQCRGLINGNCHDDQEKTGHMKDGQG